MQITYMIFHIFIFTQSPFVGTIGIFPSRVVSISYQAMLLDFVSDLYTEIRVQTEW